MRYERGAAHMMHAGNVEQPHLQWHYRCVLHNNNISMGNIRRGYGEHRSNYGATRAQPKSNQGAT